METQNKEQVHVCTDTAPVQAVSDASCDRVTIAGEVLAPRILRGEGEGGVM